MTPSRSQGTSCCACRSSGTRRRRAGVRYARTWRTSSCTACCTCRATITRCRAKRLAWKRARPRSSRRSATPIPTPWPTEPVATTSDTDERDEPRPTLLERLSAFLTREPEDRGELLDLLRGAFERRLLDAEDRK